MSSLTDREELVGFFSYSRRDDQHSDGALSRLRGRIQDELRLQLGRDFRLWQDTAAIPEGALWEDEIKRAIAESIFFIPIVTPSAVSSSHCRLEFNSFLAREAELGRRNLIFPLLYVRVPALEREAEWRHDEVLKIIGTRQYCDWLELRHRDLREGEVSKKIEVYCNNIVEALRQPWISPEERRAAEARRDAERQQQTQEDERRRLEAEAQVRAREAEARGRAEAAAQSKREAEEQRRAREAAEREAAAKRDAEIAARRRAEAERRAAKAASKDAGGSPAAWNHPALIVPLVCVILVIVLFASGVWSSPILGRYFIQPFVPAAVFAFLFWHYGRADPAKSIFGGAILYGIFAALQLEIIFVFFPAITSLYGTERTVLAFFHGIAVSFAAAVSIMAVGAWLCPILRLRSYWIIALVLWPLMAAAFALAVPVLLTSTGTNPSASTVAEYYFVAYLARLAIELACVGFWLARPFHADKASAAAV